MGTIILSLVVPSLLSGTTAQGLQVTKCSSSLGLSVHNNRYIMGEHFSLAVCAYNNNYTGIIIEDIISLTNLCYKDNNNYTGIIIEDIFRICVKKKASMLTQLFTYFQPMHGLCPANAKSVLLIQTLSCS